MSVPLVHMSRMLKSSRGRHSSAHLVPTWGIYFVCGQRVRLKAQRHIGGRGGGGKEVKTGIAGPEAPRQPAGPRRCGGRGVHHSRRATVTEGHVQAWGGGRGVGGWVWSQFKVHILQHQH